MSATKLFKNECILKTSKATPANLNMPSTLFDDKVLGDSEIKVSVAKPAQVRHTRTISEIEVEGIDWLKRVYVEERFVRIEGAAILRIRIGTNAWNTGSSELAGTLQ